MRRDRLRGGNKQEKAQYEAPRAPERTPFEGGVEGSSHHPSLKGQDEGRDAYSVLRVGVPIWYVFPRYAPYFYIFGRTQFHAAWRVLGLHELPACRALEVRLHEGVRNDDE